MNIIETIAREFQLRESQVQQTVALIDEGNTIPFIARYRKEATGGLSDVVLRWATAPTLTTPSSTS